MTTQQLWRAIHVYPRVRGVEGFNDLLASVRELLPCGDCQRHFDEYLTRCPPDTSSREALFAWGWAFHNAVNARIGKPRLKLDEVQSRWAFSLAAISTLIVRRAGCPDQTVAGQP